MGIKLVEGRDLIVEGDRVFMKTTQELEPIDVIYRRVDETPKSKGWPRIC